MNLFKNNAPPTVKLVRVPSLFMGHATIPQRATSGSLGYDLSVSEPILIHPGGSALVATGLALADVLPPGVAMMIFPRSSTFRKYGLMIGNSIGLVDTDYTGEIKVLVWNTTDKDVLLETEVRIAQLVFVQVALPFLVEVNKQAQDQERGGFGSTGA